MLIEKPEAPGRHFDEVMAAAQHAAFLALPAKKGNHLRMNLAVLGLGTRWFDGHGEKKAMFVVHFSSEGLPGFFLHFYSSPLP